MFSPLERRQAFGSAEGSHYRQLPMATWRRDGRNLNKAARHGQTLHGATVSPKKGMATRSKGTHQPLMPRQGGGSARSASSFVFNWDMAASSGGWSAFRVLLRTFLHLAATTKERKEGPARPGRQDTITISRVVLF